MTWLRDTPQASFDKLAEDMAEQRRALHATDPLDAVVVVPVEVAKSIRALLGTDTRPTIDGMTVYASHEIGAPVVMSAYLHELIVRANPFIIF